MLTFVVICNLLIGLFNFWIVWKIYKLRQWLVKVSKVLARFDQRVHRLLSGAPEVIIRGKTGTNRLRNRYQILKQQLQQLSYILKIIRLGSQLIKFASF